MGISEWEGEIEEERRKGRSRSLTKVAVHYSCSLDVETEVISEEELNG